ncbi:unnamed protein product [Protopolystoma xenopodis]|uniref:Uncharacterized protein n=1 Tax=Protopolystoma xenopodis TaxID=117903 RepID=A0A3S5CU96_9PLAT|nr:unnamed protein product [Protopolystoma xenopodis]
MPLFFELAGFWAQTLSCESPELVQLFFCLICFLRDRISVDALSCKQHIEARTRLTLGTLLDPTCVPETRALRELAKFCKHLCDSAIHTLPEEEEVEHRIMIVAQQLEESIQVTPESLQNVSNAHKEAMKNSEM